MTTTQKIAKTLRYAGFEAKACSNLDLILVKNANDADIAKATEMLTKIYKNFDSVILTF